jgi:hypothetical protein
MNRRNFIGSLLTAGAGFAILPPAATARIWKAIRPPFLECPTQGNLTACQFTQLLVDETPKFYEEIMMDIWPTDDWILNVATATAENGTPTEVTQDRYRSVFPNTTKTWTRVVGNGTGCAGNPCDPPEHTIGYGVVAGLDAVAAGFRE